MKYISISLEPLDVMACINAVSSPLAGGIDVFIGTVRAETKGRQVVRLEFEAYEQMALKELEKLVINARQQWPLQQIVVHHRVGVLVPGDVAVIIAVAAAHRAAAFEACRYLIDTLKMTVPIWKKEVFDDGEVWVAAHP